MNHKDKLIAEIDKLQHDLLISIPQELREAAESGDIRDNSDYAEILSRQHIIDIRLSQLLSRLRCYRELNIHDIPTDCIGIGSLIKANHLESNQEITFKVVISDISDDLTEVEEITVNSPIGKAFLNKKVADTAVVYVGTGSASRKNTYTITDIKTIHNIL